MSISIVEIERLASRVETSFENVSERLQSTIFVLKKLIVKAVATVLLARMVSQVFTAPLLHKIHMSSDKNWQG